MRRQEFPKHSPEDSDIIAGTEALYKLCISSMSAKLVLLSIQTIDGRTEGNHRNVNLYTCMTFYTSTLYIYLLWVSLQCWNKSMIFFSFLYFLNFLQ